MARFQHAKSAKMGRGNPCRRPRVRVFPFHAAPEWQGRVKNVAGYGQILSPGSGEVGRRFPCCRNACGTANGPVARQLQMLPRFSDFLISCESPPKSVQEGVSSFHPSPRTGMSRTLSTKHEKTSDVVRFARALIPESI
ncbi:hypothetical protein Sfum_3883 [Syntrophobacter fumaroxidans MPOB]|uniref:Uncharacterized protein n=1 Tax=Syntrophobacter fumaroxidans (strain DSM 10017 / MPOB) TaxID=335543 RepID=A0LQ50_SYNFM|nr:hypothetical protein Sfum_3883 [Syntrophobacter fumaroxidans MPOB]